MKQLILNILIISYCFQTGYAQTAASDFSIKSTNLVNAALEAASPSTLPNIQYHLTARPWNALNISRDVYLSKNHWTLNTING